MKANKLFSYLLILSFLIGSLTFTRPVMASTGEYHLMVNRVTNTVTAYKKQSDGSFEPVKVMLASTGGKLTPLGTFKTPIKYRWKILLGNVWGQYSTRIVDHVLFHSIPYYKLDPGTMMRGQFEKLGTVASHGCVRLNAADAKWIYENCALGTKVTVYDSNNPGPLGKPKPVPYPVYNGFDPTDTWSPGHPVVNIKPTLKVPKKITLSANDTSYDLLKGIKATSYDGNDITNDVEIDENIDFETPGKYTIKYSITDSIGNTVTKSVTAVLK